ncbi:F-box/FBD/LRR-repeat protein At1g13570 isoform X2 [Medicago truncatula]|uniref:F-box/FBD/LRR-repeat protein At1g13570 isoform X2 n=1 Tax=Medicago truncatula TaxID=3880 RepID=UPI000D2F3053|nr:F-box/FBD/LRR-repeat protein At1g13570 isoform X2 [Medicago truncatula]
MKRREQSQSPCVSDEEPDRVSSLPGHVIDHILSILPIKEAARTSILSTNWRYKWTTLPNLVFDNECLSETSKDLLVIKSKLSRIIDHVLLLRSGPIKKFKLSRDHIDVTDIDRWTLYLTRWQVKEFVLEIWKNPDQRYKIPSWLFSCQSLHHLELLECWLIPPSTFQGFKNLKSLDLQYVTLTKDAVENLISSCLMLERLILMECDGFKNLNIHAPNLQYFLMEGKFEDISFKNTSQLADVFINLSENFESKQGRLHERSSNLVEFFIHLPHIRSLEIQNYFLKYLALGVVPVELPTRCIDLSYISICINFNDSKEISAAVCLFRSLPNLRELEMVARSEEQPVQMTPRAYLDQPIMQVKHVRIVGISGIKSELDFISFLLLSFLVLEKMTVKPALNVGPELMKELLRMRRASRAQVIYLD